MQKIDKLVQRVINSFQANRGKASMYCSAVEAYNVIIENVIKRFHAKTPNEQILIIVDTYEKRLAIKNYLSKQDINFENNYDIKILTDTYVNVKFVYAQRLVIILTDGYNQVIPKHFAQKTNQFVLCIFTKHCAEAEYMINLRKLLPDIVTSDIIATVKEDYLYSPVEEHRYPIALDDESLKKYNYYTEYINNAVAIFGNTGVIEKCRVGDIENNISASEYRYNLAVANGWSDNLDVTSEFLRKIDEVYNPNALAEYAHNFYNFTKLRKDLLTDYYGKFDAVAEICNRFKDSKILIVSLRGEYAADVTNYINNNTDLICGDYHDCLDPKPMYDEFGEPILVKSGVNKGEVRVAGAQLQSSMNEARFNQGIINVLSIKNASNPKLKIACDLVIFTSPMCADIVEFKQRFTNVNITTNPTLTYIVYCADTTEVNKLDKTTTKKVLRNIINENENIIDYDENNGSIIL